MRFTHPRAVLGVLLLTVLVSARAAAQVPAPQEAALLTAIGRDPQQIGNYLDLAKMYSDQRRYDEAERMLNRAIDALRQQRTMPQPSAIVSNVPTPGQVDPQSVRVGGNVPQPTKIKHVSPRYPTEALQARVSGVVLLEVVVDREGKVAQAKVLKGISLLDAAAINAVSQWEFTPTLLNGVPVPVIMTVTVNFTIG